MVSELNQQFQFQAAVWGLAPARAKVFIRSLLSISHPKLELLELIVSRLAISTALLTD